MLLFFILLPLLQPDSPKTILAAHPWKVAYTKTIHDTHDPASKNNYSIDSTTNRNEIIILTSDSVFTKYNADTRKKSLMKWHLENDSVFIATAPGVRLAYPVNYICDDSIIFVTKGFRHGIPGGKVLTVTKWVKTNWFGE